MNALQRIATLSTALATVMAIGLAVVGATSALAAETTLAQKKDPSDQGTYLGTPWVSGGVGESAR
ncbi:hypothetical protein, partial [Halochromatium sp.]